MSQPLPNQALPTCPTCTLEPLPESTQALPFILLQVILFFISLKLSLILLLIGYSLSHTTWVCPLCKREVQVPSQIGKGASAREYLIFRLNDFMLLMSKGKFRIFAVVAVVGIGYWYWSEPRYQYSPRVKIERTWKSIVGNCGYDVYMDNSFRFKYLYGRYEDTLDWELQGVVLGKQTNTTTTNTTTTTNQNDNPRHSYQKLRIKMQPTQFKDPDTEDIELLGKHTNLTLERGDIVKFKGEWSGHRGHVLIFLYAELEKTGRKIGDFGEIQVLSHGMLRENSE